MNKNKLIAVSLMAGVMLAACGVQLRKEGSSGVVDGTRWNADAAQMVQVAQEARR